MKNIIKNKSKFIDNTFSIRNCKLGYECKQRWDLLSTTSDLNIKHCNECKTDVYMIQNDAELMNAIKNNHCVAIKVPNKEDILVGMRVTVTEDYDKPSYLRNKKSE